MIGRSRMERLTASCAGACFFVVAHGAKAQSGHLFLPEETFTGRPAAGVAVADLDNDGFDDVFVLGGDAVNERALSVYAGGASGLTAGQIVPVAGFTGPQGESIAIGDINGDQRVDVVAADNSGVLSFEQDATGQLAAPSNVSTAEASLLRVGDFNGDGSDDLVSLAWGSGTVEVFFQSAGALQPAQSFDVTHEGFDDLEIGDLDADGLDDIVVMSGQGLVDHVGALLQRPGGFAPATYMSVPDHRGPSGLGVGDLTGDAYDDVVISFEFERDFALIPHAATGFGTPAVHQILGALGDAAEVLDLTGDGLDDVIFLPSGKALAQSSGGSLIELESTSVPASGPHAVAFGDIDGDGLTDMATPASYPGGVNVSFGTAANLSVIATVEPDPMLATEEATVTLEVANAGPDDATDVTVTMEPEEGLLSGGLQHASSTCDFSSCNLGVLAANTSTIVTFVARPREVGTYGADVHVSAYNFDPDASNDDARPTVTVLPAADLSVGLGQTYRPNGTVDGALVIVGNAGPYEAERPRVVVELDASLSYHGYEGGDGAPSPAACTNAGSIVTCTFDTLPEVDVFENPAGTQIHLLLSGSGTLRATIESDTGDPDLSNNDAELTIQSATGTSADADMGPTAPNGSGDEGGCGCRLIVDRSTRHTTIAFVLIGLGWVRRRLRARRARCDVSILG